MEQLTGTMSSVPNSNNYENMSHKPQINGVELTGNKTSEELGLGGGDVTRQELEDALRNKVDKETGKGLSSNDFGNSEKSKLEGIEEGAQKNVPVPSKVSELENDSKFQTEEQVQEITQVQHLTLAKQSALYPEKMDPVQEAHLSSCSVSKKKMRTAIKWITQPKMPA